MHILYIEADLVARFSWPSSVPPWHTLPSSLNCLNLGVTSSFLSSSPYNLDICVLSFCLCLCLSVSLSLLNPFLFFSFPPQLPLTFPMVTSLTLVLGSSELSHSGGFFPINLPLKSCSTSTVSSIGRVGRGKRKVFSSKQVCRLFPQKTCTQGYKPTPYSQCIGWPMQRGAEVKFILSQLY